MDSRLDAFGSANRGLVNVPQPLFTEINAPGGVHVEQAHCRRSCGRQANNVSASDDKMIAPYVSTRIEQGHHSERFGIDAREIWSFVCVTPVTGEREPVEIVGTTVLP